MVVPSFLYSALDIETQRMTDELAALGGGDARAVAMEMHCIIDDRLARSDSQTIWLKERAVSIRDASQPLNAPIAESMSNYATSGSYLLHDVLQCSSHEFVPVRYAPDNMIVPNSAGFKNFHSASMVPFYSLQEPFRMGVRRI